MNQPMTTGGLIALLEECDPDAEVRLAHQPAWPLQFAMAGIATTDDLDTPPDDPDTQGVRAGEPGVVWLVAGEHPDGATPYAPEQLWHLARRG